MNDTGYSKSEIRGYRILDIDEIIAANKLAFYSREHTVTSK
jgi:hypothetical protein